MMPAKDSTWMIIKVILKYENNVFIALAVFEVVNKLFFFFTKQQIRDKFNVCTRMYTYTHIYARTKQGFSAIPKYFFKCLPCYNKSYLFSAFH